MTRETWFWWMRMLTIDVCIFELVKIQTGSSLMGVFAFLSVTLLMGWAEVTFGRKPE